MKYSLMIGRWQPFHDGHKALIQKVLDEGKHVCVGIRDTAFSEDDPYTVEERKIMIKKALPQKEVITLVIPDIEEIVIGRKVGYGIRELSLGEELEAISGTKTREELRKQGKLR